MRRRQTFMLTILAGASRENSLLDHSIAEETQLYCGQIKVISSGKIYNFTSIDELNRLIALEMEPSENDPAPAPPSQ